MPDDVDRKPGKVDTSGEGLGATPCSARPDMPETKQEICEYYEALIEEAERERDEARRLAEEWRHHACAVLAAPGEPFPWEQNDKGDSQSPDQKL